MPKDRHPPRFPPPQFPTRRKAIFATTPPAIFPAILGLLGLGLALRKACVGLDLAEAAVEVLLGAVLGLWIFAVVAIKVKVIRRFGVIFADLRPLPGRVGLAAASMSGMAAAGVLVPYSAGLAEALVWAALVIHAVLAGLLVAALGAEAREINPSWHLNFVGFIVAGPVLAQLGWVGSAAGIFWMTLPIAVAIWGGSVWQLMGRIPPAPLRPMLAIHLSAAALLATTAGMIGQTTLQVALLVLGAAILLALVLSTRWLLAAGFTPIWGAMTFPLAAYATALLSYGGPLESAGLVVSFVALGMVPAIAWAVLRQWPGDRLAAKTNAAEA